MSGLRLNVPNRITLARLLGSLLLFVLLALIQESVLDGGGAAGWAALLLFILTAATDWLDGHLARRLGMVTVTGRIMDPFVDKVVVCGSFVFLASMRPSGEILHPWMVVVVLAREFLVNAIRGYAESQGRSFGAEWAGKAKMVLQCIAVGFLLGLRPLSDASGPAGWLEGGALVFTWSALVATVWSGLVYARRAPGLLRGPAT